MKSQNPKVRLTKKLSDKQFEWRNDKRITAWTRQNGLLSEYDQEKWLKRVSEDESIQMFGILTDRAEGPMDAVVRTINVGTCGLTSLSFNHGTAEFSLFIGPEYQESGYGRAALVELLKYGFKHLRLNCIWGETFVDNPALRLFLSLGMKEEGRVRQRYFKNGEFVDAILVSILQKEAEEQTWWTPPSS